MARLLVNGEWYDQVAPTALYEGEFENIFLQQAGLVFPEFVVVPFKCLVSSEYGVHKPDLALVDRRYRRWWVVEVEMAHHSLLAHVVPQVQVFATGDYGKEHAKYLSSQAEELDPELVDGMLKGQPPQVLVVVNAPRPDWVPILGRFSALVAVFEIFRSRLSRQVFRLDGDRPTLPVDVITRCVFDPALPKFLKVLSPAAFPHGDGEAVRISYENAATEWKRVDAQDSVWLVPTGPNPLPAGVQYEVVCDEAGVLSIRVVDPRRR